jgi:hypothetical protein
MAASLSGDRVPIVRISDREIEVGPRETILQVPVYPRHSWNSNRRISSWTMFNLTRHSHHHAQGEVPFQALEPYPNSPMMIKGRNFR